MPRFRRSASSFAAALLVFWGTAAIGSAQTFSHPSPRIRPSSPQAQAPQASACGLTTLTEGTTTITPGNSVACTSGGFITDNHYWRAFSLEDMGIATAFSVCSVTIGVEEATSGGGTQPVTINLYTSDPVFPDGTLTLIGTTSSTVADQTFALDSFAVSGTAPQGSQLVVEIFTPNGSDGGNRFFIGSNPDPESALSYISASDCNFPTPVPTAEILHPDMHIVITVEGDAVAPEGLDVDAPLQVANGNGVLEVGEDAVIGPEWTNGGLADISMTGVASNLGGPPGLNTNYTIEVGTADYGTITSGHSGTCTDCYTISITGDRPVQHFDATMNETVTPSPFTLRITGGGPTPITILKTWTLHVGGSFSDVDPELATDPFYPSIETIFHFGVTGGCGDGTTFCPSTNVLRQEMAPFLLKGFLGSGHTPPPCTGLFVDVPCPATPEFPYSDFIEDLSIRGITGGCAVGPPALYCPGDPVTRAQIAPFLLKTLMGGSYAPPDCTGVFTDVPCPATPDFPFSNFIEDLSTRGITAGCQIGPPALYCPDSIVSREQMAAFLTRTFSLVLYGP
jgi:hypothetical protein